MTSEEYTPGQVLKSLSKKQSSAFKNDALKSLFSPSNDQQGKTPKKKPVVEDEVSQSSKKKSKKADKGSPAISNKSEVEGSFTVEKKFKKKHLNNDKQSPESVQKQEISGGKKKKKKKADHADEVSDKELNLSHIAPPSSSTKCVKRKASEIESESTQDDKVPVKRRKKPKDVAVVVDREKSLKDADDIVKKKKKKKTGIGNKEERTIFVGNLPVAYTKKEIRKLFKKYGEIETIRLRSAAPADPTLPKKVAVIKKELHPERHNINAYIVFINKEDALKALKRNGKEVAGFHIRVDLASNAKKHDFKQSVFVGNLPFDSEEEPLRQHFSVCGKILNIRIIRDSKSGLGKGFCYVQFDSPDGVAVALQLNEKEFSGRKLRINRCVKKEKSKQTSDNVVKANPKKQKSKGNENKSKSPASNKPVRFLKPSNVKSGSFSKKNSPKKKKKKNKGWTPTVSRDGKEIPHNQPNFLKARFRLQRKQKK